VSRSTPRAAGGIDGHGKVMATTAASTSQGTGFPARRFHLAASTVAWSGACFAVIAAAALTAGRWVFSYRIGTEAAYARRDGRGGISIGAFRGHVRVIAGWAGGPSAADQEPDPPVWPSGLQVARYPIASIARIPSYQPPGGLGFGWRESRFPDYRNYIVWVPHWFLVATCALVAALSWRWGRSRQRASLRCQGRCVSCGYDLRMTPDRCPECGAMPKRPADGRRAGNEVPRIP